jgi:hypothetical protein
MVAAVAAEAMAVGRGGVAVTRDPLCAKGGKMVAVLMGHG